MEIRFEDRALTSYAGVELFREYLRRTGFSQLIRQRLQGAGLRGDFSPAAIIRLFVVLVVVGGTRLRHVSHLVGDPVIQRFCESSVLPTARTMSRWLSQCKASVRAAMLRLNMDLIAGVVRPLNLARLTIDVDGTVVSTGFKVERAFRGYNPHRRKVPSDYPITAQLAQTGHVVRVQNRSGNVHDGKASSPFLRDVYRDVREIAPRSVVEFRMDGAFFRHEIIRWLESRAEYAVKTPFYHWSGLKQIVQERKSWNRVKDDLDGFYTDLYLKTWDRTLRVAIYRKHVAHKTAKNFQLDLFDPSDGHWEYSAITTNKDVTLGA